MLSERLWVLGLFFGLSACTALKPRGQNTPADSTLKHFSTKTVGVSNARIMTQSLVTNLEISRDRFKVSLTGSNPMGIDEIKETVLLNAQSRHNSDVIVDPLFHISQSASGFTVVLTGYSAKYTGLRTATHMDKQILKAEANARGRVGLPIVALSSKVTNLDSSGASRHSKPKNGGR